MVLQSPQWWRRTGRLNGFSISTHFHVMTSYGVFVCRRPSGKDSKLTGTYNSFALSAPTLYIKRYGVNTSTSNLEKNYYRVDKKTTS
jgi:hypothetical protein